MSSAEDRQHSSRKSQDAHPARSQLCEDVKTETSDEGTGVCVKKEETLDLNIYNHGDNFDNTPEVIAIKEEETDKEDYLYCEVCKSYFFNKCEVHGAAHFITDTPVPMGVMDRAKQTLPPGLEIRKSSIPDAGLGVFNKGETVPVGAHFGPYQGELVDREQAMNSGYSWVFSGVQPRGNAAADEGDDDDDDDDQTFQGTQQPYHQVGQQSSTSSQQGGQQPSTSQSQSKGKGKGKHRGPPTPSTVRDGDEMSEAEILQQAQNLISNIRAPAKSEHERRVRDFCRYMESEIIRVPESLWDECSFTIMNIIRGFKTAQQHAFHQNYGSQYQQHGGYYTQQCGTFQQPQQPSTFQQSQQPGTFRQSQQPGTFRQSQQPGTFQQLQSTQDGTVYPQIPSVSSSVLNTSLGLDTSLSHIWSTSTPVQSPGGRQLDTPNLTPTTTAVIITAPVPGTQSSAKSGSRMAQEDSD